MAGSPDYGILKTAGGSSALLNADVGAGAQTFDVSVGAYETIWLFPYYVAGFGGGTGTATAFTITAKALVDVSSDIVKGFEPFGSDLLFPWPEESVSAPTVTMAARSYSFTVTAADTSEAFPVIIMPVNHFPLPIRFSVSATGGASGEEGIQIFGVGV